MQVGIVTTKLHAHTVITSVPVAGGLSEKVSDGDEISLKGAGFRTMDMVASGDHLVGATSLTVHAFVLPIDVPIGTAVMDDSLNDTNVAALDVSLIDLVDGDFLAWNASEGKWTAQSRDAASQASVLVDYTAPGDAGHRADNFHGSVLNSKWTRELTAPVSAIGL